MSATYNLSAIFKLVNAAFDLEGLNDFCFFHFRPVYDQFQATDRKQARVRMLLEHAERRGRLDELLTRIEADNPAKYQQFAEQVGALPKSDQPAGGPVFNQQGQQVGTQYNVAGDLTIHKEPSTNPQDN